MFNALTQSQLTEAMGGLTSAHFTRWSSERWLGTHTAQTSVPELSLPTYSMVRWLADLRGVGGEGGREDGGGRDEGRTSQEGSSAVFFLLALTRPCSLL